jgi:hypothetical protein
MTLIDEEWVRVNECYRLLTTVIQRVPALMTPDR